MSNNMKLIAEAIALVDSVPAGPWSFGGIDSIGGGSIYDLDVSIASVEWDNGPVNPRIRRTRTVDEADRIGAFIARSRNLIPTLALALTEADVELAKARALLELGDLAELNRNTQISKLEHDLADLKTRAQLNVDDLAQMIRKVDGAHTLGAGALAQALVDSGLFALTSTDTAEAVNAIKAEALEEAADWLNNGEQACFVAYEGPSNRREVKAAYNRAIEDPEGWLRSRAAELTEKAENGPTNNSEMKVKPEAVFFTIDPRAGKYVVPVSLELAIQYAKEEIEDWSYDDDVHGYCHTRPMLIALVAALIEGDRA